MKTIYQRFSQVAEQYAGESVVLAPGKRDLTYGRLLEFIDSTRDELHRHGVGRDTRLGTIFPDRAQSAVAHLLSVSTCISVPLNPALPASDLAARGRDLGLDALLLSSDLPPDLLASAASPGVPVLVAEPAGSEAGLFEISTPPASAAAVDTSFPGESDIAVLLQTSGTSAQPKIVPQTQLSRVTMIERITRALGIQPDDICLNMMPMHHTAGLTGEFLAPITAGASVVFAQFDAERVPEYVSRYQATWYSVVPTMHQAILNSLSGRKDVLKSTSVRLARSTSAKLSVSLRQQLERAYGVPVLEFYGSSETGIAAFAGDPAVPFPTGSVGQPIHDGVRVFDDSGEPVSAGTIGEICVSGPTVMSGYLNDAELSSRVLRDGWYRTGDAGYFDAEGFLYVSGRIREVVNRGGEKFSLNEIDEALTELPGVGASAAFSAPHPELGHEVYAAVVVAQAARWNAYSIRSALSQRLPWACVPKQVFLVDKLPVNSTGKVMRQELAELLDQRSTGTSA